jgi:hypothetical protein
MDPDLAPDSALDPDPALDPAIFVTDLHANRKLFIFLIFSAYYLLKVHLHLFSKTKSHKKRSQNSSNQGLFTIFAR